MSISKPGLPKGTRDFGPDKMVRRNFILDEIKKKFRIYGFQPLETPAMENLQVLTGKYGEEGDQLIFKILNSGNFAESLTPALLEEGYKKIIPDISEKALRYDLTVPFARYVVMNRNDITFPFKRYQIQPVWRADRPQKGRYREFYQCDADVIGTDSLICEAEIVLMINEIFSNLGIKDYTIKVNNRKILDGIARLHDQTNRLSDLTIAIDKLDKIGEQGVIKELIAKEFEPAAAEAIVAYFTGYKNQGPDNDRKLQYFLQDFMDGNIEAGEKGIEEIKAIFRYVKAFGLDNHHLEFDVSLARGLSYYTGAIFEVKANNIQIGSICGGGRYDNLTGVFGLPGVSGVGISFGVDRIYDVLEELNAFPLQGMDATRVLFCCFDEKHTDYCLHLLGRLRQTGISAEIYPEASKLKKQLDYANKKNIPFVIIAGEEEINSGVLTLKNMLNGEQIRLPFEELIEKIKLH
jgi:histidyl-tRNA synthetase